MKRKMSETLILHTLIVSGTDLTAPQPHLPEVSSQVEVTIINFDAYCESRGDVCGGGVL